MRNRRSSPSGRLRFAPHSFVVRISLSSLSAILLIASFPNFNLWPLAWFGLVPLFFAIENQKPFKTFLLSYLFGVLFFLGTIYWLIHVTLPGMIAVVLYLALYFGLFGLISGLGPPAPGPRSLFFIPSAWVALELARSHFLTGFGWALLGHSQSYNLPMIQIADITGAYGVSFLIVMANVALYLTIKDFRKKNYSFHYAAIALFLIILAASYGTFRLRNIFTGESLKVAVIQGNIPQAKKWDAHFREDILRKYDALTREAAEQRPDLIVWPETSVPGFLESDRDLSDRISNLAKGVNIPILAGAPREDAGRYYNSAFLIGDDGRIKEHYDKVHLVPFGEYIPLKPLFFFVDKFAPLPIGDFSAGTDYTVFGYFIERRLKDKDLTTRLVKKVKFSCLVCFEDIFPGPTREFVKRGANLLINITNDAWFSLSSAPYQHAQSSVFRAVENRVNVVRAANTGLSCFIDQKGQVVGAVEEDGKNLFVDGLKVHDIILTRTRTFYTLYGDIFAYMCALFTIGCLIINKNRRRA